MTTDKDMKRAQKWLDEKHWALLEEHEAKDVATLIADVRKEAITTLEHRFEAISKETSGDEALIAIVDSGVFEIVPMRTAQATEQRAKQETLASVYRTMEHRERWASKNHANPRYIEACRDTLKALDTLIAKAKEGAE